MKAVSFFAAALALSLLAASGANAFTIENQGASADAAARYADPEKRFSDSKDGQKVFQSGNTTIKFGTGGSFNQNYNPNSMFEPNGRPQTER